MRVIAQQRSFFLIHIGFFCNERKMKKADTETGRQQEAFFLGIETHHDTTSRKQDAVYIK